MITTKDDVRLDTLRNLMQPALDAAEDIYASLGLDLVVTSTNDGKHMRGSLHYKNLAFDIRTRTLADGVATVLREKIGSDFDVINEGDHIHVEYDP